MPLTSVSIEGRLTFRIFRTLVCEIAGNMDCQVCKSIQLLGVVSPNPTRGSALYTARAPPPDRHHRILDPSLERIV